MSVSKKMQPSAGSGENVNIYGRQLSRRLAESSQLCCILARAADEVLELTDRAEVDADRWLLSSVSVHLRTMARFFCPACTAEGEQTLRFDISSGKLRRAYLRTLLTMIGMDEPMLARKIGFDPRNLDKLFSDKPRRKDLESAWRAACAEFLKIESRVM